MKYMDLGKTGLKVTELGFGGIPIMALGIEEGAAVVRHAFDMGINFFDTAHIYADSEVKIGLALETVRDEVILATKSQERKADQTAEHIALSLKNLRTDRLDLFQFHQIGDMKQLEEILAPGGAMEAVRQARDEGKIRYYGFSSHDIPTAIEACKTGLFATIQFPFNFIEREPLDELFETAEKQGMGIIGMKPFGGGLLERADLCIKFLQRHPNVVPIPGFVNQGEIDEVIQMYRSPAPLTPADLEEMDRIHSELGARFCHRCGYCGPCEQGVDIIKVMISRSFVGRLGPAGAVDFAKDAMETVEQCIECGECAEKCPYNLPIPEVLKENYTYYQELVAQIR